MSPEAASPPPRAAVVLTAVAVAAGLATGALALGSHRRPAVEDLVWWSAWLLWCPTGVFLARQTWGRRFGTACTAIAASVLLAGVAGTGARALLLSTSVSDAMRQLGVTLSIVQRLLADLPAFALLLPLVFPDGRLPGRRWRPVAIVGAAAAGVAVLADLCASRPLDDDLPLANPLAVPAPAGVAALGAIGTAVLVGSFVAGLISLVVRRRRSTGAERAGVTLFGIGSSWLIVLVLLDVVGDRAGIPTGVVPAGVFQGIALLLLPAAAAAAPVRRIRYEADPLLSRSLTYLILTTAIVGTYAAATALIGAAADQHAALSLSLLITGLLALTLSPVKAAVQRKVERLVLGLRSDPYAALLTLAERLAATPTPREALDAATRTVAESLRLPYVALAVRSPAQPGDRETIVSEHGRPGDVALSIPLRSGIDTVGSLRLAARTPRDQFSPADERLLSGLADRLAGTVALVGLTEELQRSREELVRAREEERRRIRRELHDGVGPVLASAAMALGRARRAFDVADAQHEWLGEAADDVRRAIVDVRALVHDLRPPALDELGLVGAIRQRATSLSDPSRTTITVVADELGPLPAAVEVAAYRIAGEALTNVDRHAAARQCRVELAADPTGLSIAVTDDGRGAPADASEGLGLASMRRRCAELGGRFDFGPRPDSRAGTQLRAWLPIR